MRNRCLILKWRHPLTRPTGSVGWKCPSLVCQHSMFSVPSVFSCILLYFINVVAAIIHPDWMQQIGLAGDNWRVVHIYWGVIGCQTHSHVRWTIAVTLCVLEIQRNFYWEVESQGCCMANPPLKKYLCFGRRQKCITVHDKFRFIETGGSFFPLRKLMPNKWDLF